jgi:hypothetical protein
MVAQLVNEFPVFYGTRRFIIVITKARPVDLNPKPPYFLNIILTRNKIFAK